MYVDGLADDPRSMLGFSLTVNRNGLSRCFKPDSVSGIGESHTKIISTQASSIDDSIDVTMRVIKRERWLGHGKGARTIICLPDHVGQGNALFNFSCDCLPSDHHNVAKHCQLVCVGRFSRRKQHRTLSSSSINVIIMIRAPSLQVAFAAPRFGFASSIQPP